MTVAEAIESFLFHCQYEKNLSPKTLKAYGTDLRQFVESLGDSAGERDVREVQKEVLREHIRGLFDRFAVKSVKRKVATLKAFFNYLEREDEVERNPFRKMQVRIREQRRLPRAIPKAEVEQLLQHLYQLLSECKASNSSDLAVITRDIAVFEVIFATGARVSEVCGLKRTDIDLSEGTISILSKGGKERRIQLCTEAAVSALRRYGAQQRSPRTHNYYFLNLKGNRMTEQSVRRALERYGKSGGLTRHITPHMLRHSVATLLLDEGVDIRYIQHLLGHSSITTTQLYTEVDREAQKRVLSVRHPRNRMSAG